MLLCWHTQGTCFRRCRVWLEPWNNVKDSLWTGWRMGRSVKEPGWCQFPLSEILQSTHTLLALSSDESSICLEEFVKALRLASWPPRSQILWSNLSMWANECLSGNEWEWAHTPRWGRQDGKKPENAHQAWSCTIMQHQETSYSVFACWISLPRPGCWKCRNFSWF